jgi:hypothetical protein
MIGLIPLPCHTHTASGPSPPLSVQTDMSLSVRLHAREVDDASLGHAVSPPHVALRAPSWLGRCSLQGPGSLQTRLAGATQAFGKQQRPWGLGRCTKPAPDSHGEPFSLREVMVQTGEQGTQGSRNV